jgi:ATP-binding cassette subfamily B protein
MAATLMVLAGIMVFAMARLAAAGRSLHHEFASRAAAVDGEMFDVIGNIPWYGRFAAWVASTAVSMPRSIVN